MKWLLPFGVMLARRFSPQELVDLAVKVWPQVWQKIPPDQRVSFLANAAAKHLDALTAGLSRQDRVALMNALLPTVAREFPLSEVDFLSAFAAPGDRYNPENLDV
ncbi:MAG TPA: hypothetical protein PLN43_00250 [Anaerolineales bacterium]|jgi:hypothetical protein|nr:hypothetical protein [Anaerolineales bacterium]HMZ06225.1 hypothetical protein [Anaerolineales bacterium]HNA87701.1 hypothetical protein [Anaerolineales bacterium]HNB34648.1 hypothetical protein [Anaerolineales bacterium]HNC07309.1 hypothetical protein [Anaerolineales bacterium]